MANETDRIYDQLKSQNDMLHSQGVLLATLVQSQKDTHERLFGEGGTGGHITYLHGEVSKHSKQIVFWRGALSVLGVLWAAMVSLGCVLLNRHR